ncbi:ATP-binding protein [Desulfotomaculum sp. 1211_IL3151]|uniref:ATP-binding protein n=1 Tax=Desulfotomaculum sp. 1211_IL3151 TaxID=3084055 RepID=UPI002FDAA5B8
MTKDLRVLIVEDSADDTLLLLRELRKGGYNIFYQQVDNRQDMLVALAEAKWDIVIADYVMPSFGGMDALRLVKERDLDIPFIILSGNITESTAVEAMKAGAHDYIVKGNLARLIPAIEREIREAASRKQRKQLEKEMIRLDQLNLIGQMAAGIGHEIRNPLTVVRGFLQMLADKECAQYQDYFITMIEEIDRTNDIISEFLSLGRNHTSQLDWHPLNPIIENIAPLLQVDALGRNNTIEIKLEQLPQVRLNPAQIRQVILNLARNGLEAMPQGGCLTIRTFTSGDEVILSVSDQGPGITPDVLAKIGTPFFTTKERGTGLGMTVCHGIAARHQATIDIETGSSGTTVLLKFKTKPL